MATFWSRVVSVEPQFDRIGGRAPGPFSHGRLALHDRTAQSWPRLATPPVPAPMPVPSVFRGRAAV
jgi:hypothetical protein